MAGYYAATRQHNAAAPLADFCTARELYREARIACREEDDYVSMALFDALLKDEESHIDFIETQLSLLERVGLQNYALLQSSPADAAETP